MMPLIKLNCNCDQAVARVTGTLEDNGLCVLISFDSHHTRDNNRPLICPHHGTAVCNCQMVILLVYQAAGRPATLLARGQDGETWISLTIAPGQRPSEPLENMIRQALAPLPTLDISSS
jgi:hypothetical protein